MAYLITKDIIDIDAESEGAFGPCGTKYTPEQIKTHPNRQHFKMKDADGELYYEGYYVEEKGSDEFEPLDCFGMPAAGATEIHYRNSNGSYSIL